MSIHVILFYNLDRPGKLPVSLLFSVWVVKLDVLYLNLAHPQTELSNLRDLFCRRWLLFVTLALELNDGIGQAWKWVSELKLALTLDLNEFSIDFFNPLSLIFAHLYVFIKDSLRFMSAKLADAFVRWLKHSVEVRNAIGWRGSRMLELRKLMAQTLLRLTFTDLLFDSIVVV